MSDYIEINCYDKEDIEFKTVYTLSLKLKDLPKALHKDEHGCFIKYDFYHYRDGKLHTREEAIVRIDPTEYKRLNKIVKGK